MPKTSPEKLAAALRANLKRRKLRPMGQEDGRAAKCAQEVAARTPQTPGEPHPGPAAKPAKKPPENRG